MEIERKPFNFEIDGQSFRAMGNLLVMLYLERQELAHVVTKGEGDNLVRGFGNPDLCHWIAGLMPIKEEDGHNYTFAAVTMSDDDKTFRDRYGWSPAVILKEKPTPAEEAAYSAWHAKNIDKEWEDFNKLPPIDADGE